MTTTQDTVAKKPEMVARFVKATIEGWKSFMETRRPRSRRSRSEPEHDRRPIAYGMQKLRDLKVVSGGDAAKMGIGIMTDERWKKTADFMVASGC